METETEMIVRLQTPWHAILLLPVWLHVVNDNLIKVSCSSTSLDYIEGTEFV